MKRGSLIVLSGPSGTGKNTVYDGLCKLSDDISQTISATTRAPREGEKNGVDYYFITVEEFKEKIKSDEFVEYVNYGGNYYGTLKSEISRLLEDGKIVILVIEVNGAFNIKVAFPEAKTIFLVPPSIEELKKRIMLRGQNTPEETEKRIAIAEKEILLKDKYEYNVVNDDLNDCINNVYKIIKEN